MPDETGAGTGTAPTGAAAVARFHVMDIGGSHINAGVVEIDRSSTVPTARVVKRAGRDLDPHGTADEILSGWAAAGNELQAPGHAPASWAVAMPDPFDFELGRGTFDDVGKFENLADVDLKGGLAERLSTDPARVLFLHDAGAYGIGEWMFGGARGHDRAVCITLGTGVGSAFLDHGTQIQHRDDVPTNGTVHLLTIDGGPLEDTVSTRAIIAHYERVSGLSADVKTIAQRARSGNENARTVLDHALTSLGAALGPWLHAFGATVLVVGGSISRSWDILEQPFRAGVAARHPELAASLELRASTLLDEAPLLGAAHWLSQRELARS